MAPGFSSDSDDGSSSDITTPSRGEEKSLRRVSDHIPWTIFLVAVTELGERFTYRSIVAPMQNYIQNPRDDPFRPGALGMGQGSATAISYFYLGWTYMAPVLGAIVADTWLGRYKTICLGTVFSWCGALVIFATSFPTSLDHGAGLPGLLVGIFFCGLGAGGIKSNVAPLVAEQYNRKPKQLRTLPSGEKVIVDPNLTIQTIFGRYYMIINLGPLAVIPASWLELKVSFWATFAMPLVYWCLAAVVLVMARKSYNSQKPSDSVIVQAFSAFWVSLKNGRSLDAAKPSAIAERQPGRTVSWDNFFIEELKRALMACSIFCVFPMYFLCGGQIGNNLVSQAATMKTYGIPNDMMGCFNAIAVVTLVPILEKFVFPTLQKLHISFRPIGRITAGFTAMAIAFGYAAGIQALIYNSPPCYNHPLRGPCSEGGKTPNNVSVFLQVVTYVMMALAEILALLTGMEYAYTKAPKSMRSIVSSIFLFTQTIGAILGVALSSVSNDPAVLFLYAALGSGMFLTAVMFWIFFHRYDRMEEEVNMLYESECQTGEVQVQEEGKC